MSRANINNEDSGIYAVGCGCSKPSGEWRQKLPRSDRPGIRWRGYQYLRHYDAKLLKILDLASKPCYTAGTMAPTNATQSSKWRQLKRTRDEKTLIAQNFPWR